jgi:alpha/beta superfamily hydrolase
VTTEPENPSDVVVSIKNVTAQMSSVPGQFVVTIQTTHGDIEAVLVPVQGRTACVIFIGDEGAQGVYRQLSEALAEECGISSLRLRPRVPGEFTEGLLDTIAACSFLKGIGAETAVVVGHSYAGAIAVRAGTISPFIRAVVAIAPQRYGTQGVEEMHKPLLLIHGANDDVLPPLASDDVYQRANQPKEMIIIEDTGHSFEGQGPRLYQLIDDFIRKHLVDVDGPVPPAAPPSAPEE